MNYRTVILAVVFALLCSLAAATPAQNDFTIKPHHEGYHSQAGVECSLCEFVLKEVYHVITNTSDQKAIERALDNICHVLPKSIEDSCTSLINQYFPVLVDYIKQKLPPSDICKKIGLCDSSSAPVERLSQSDLECEVCKFVTDKLVSFIGSKKSKDAIIEEIHKICSIVPGSLKSSCTSLVDQYAPILAQYIVDEDKKALEHFCVTIGVCSK